MKNPKFSILIPVIKGKFLDKAIKSVLDQDFFDWELIIYDDCSPDNIVDIVDKYKDNRITFVKGKENIGASDPSRVWNNMLDMSKGDFICLLGDDDFLSKNYFTEIDKLILKYPDISVFRVKLKRIDELDNIISEVSDIPELENWDESLYERNVNKRTQSTSEFVIRKKSLDEIGGYVNFPRACGSDDATYLLLSKDKGIASTNDACAYWRKSSLNISDNDSKEMNEYKINFLLNWERKFLDDIFSLSMPLSKLYYSLEENDINLKLEKIRVESNNAREDLLNIYNSYEWKIVLILRKFFKLFFPVNSARRKTLVKFFRILKIIIKSILKIKRKFKNLFLLFGNYLFIYKSNRKRKINLSSKKIVFVDHSYHNKTKSTDFLLNFLKKNFEVTVVSNNSWNGGSYPDLSFMDESYVGVIFFQLVPPKNILNKINNDNIIFFPMYDQSGELDYGYWHEYKDLKIINFSRTLHKKLGRWKFNSMHVQYFPDLQKFNPGKKDEVFFWQRLTKISISTIIKLLDKEKVKIHIHKAIDPGQKFVVPKKEDEEKFKITYSNWFNTREQMFEFADKKGIYIAPREYEGIGLSFLEAMAKGKAVIAVNNPTMSEYIEHGRTGYLYDLNNPNEIDLSNAEEVQKNTYKYMQEGCEKWKEDKKRIMKFIKSEY